MIRKLIDFLELVELKLNGRLLAFADWQCERFGHKPIWETLACGGDPKYHHWACKRGCGPVEFKRN